MNDFEKIKSLFSKIGIEHSPFSYDKSATKCQRKMSAENGELYPVHLIQVSWAGDGVSFLFSKNGQFIGTFQEYYGEFLPKEKAK